MFCLLEFMTRQSYNIYFSKAFNNGVHLPSVLLLLTLPNRILLLLLRLLHLLFIKTMFGQQTPTPGSTRAVFTLYRMSMNRKLKTHFDTFKMALL